MRHARCEAPPRPSDRNRFGFHRAPREIPQSGRAPLDERGVGGPQYTDPVSETSRQTAQRFGGECRSDARADVRADPAGARRGYPRLRMYELYRGAGPEAPRRPQMCALATDRRCARRPGGRRCARLRPTADVRATSEARYGDTGTPGASTMALSSIDSSPLVPTKPLARRTPQRTRPARGCAPLQPRRERQARRGTAGAALCRCAGTRRD